VREQVARILSLDVDGTGFPEVGRRDPVVGGLQARWPGLRPVGFFSPYEAGAWALGEAARAGRLDGTRLRSLPRDQALAYGLDEPPHPAWLERQAEAWRPYRTWVVLLLRILLEDATGEIRGRTAGG
jgi:hypothetical protein